MAKRCVDDYDEDEERPRKKSSGRKGSGKKKSEKNAPAIFYFAIFSITLTINMHNPPKIS